MAKENHEEDSFLEKTIAAEIGGKNAAIHAYDKMMWTVRSGYLTLVFGGWGFVLKSAIEKGAELQAIKPYILLLSAFTIALSIGAYLIDRNYSRRKFRVIHAVNELVQVMMTTNFEKADGIKARLTPLLQISGDASNTNYRFKAFYNEMKVGKIIYLLTSGLIMMVATYFLTQTNS